MKKLAVVGLESSGTQWMTAILKSHPQAGEVLHASFPEHGRENTRWPDISGADKIAWMIRYEPIRLKSVIQRGYHIDRANVFLPPYLYHHVMAIYMERPEAFVLVSYEGMVGPIGKMVLDHALRQLGLDPNLLPGGAFNPSDENIKYLSGEICEREKQCI